MECSAFFENAAPRKFGSPVLLFLRAASAKNKLSSKKIYACHRGNARRDDSGFKIQDSRFEDEN